LSGSSITTDVNTKNTWNIDITNGFLNKTDLNDQELDDKIWEYASEWISKSKLCGKIPCDKKRCFDRIKLMIPMQLKDKKEKNRIMIVRIDTTNRKEFEYGLVFQKNLLKQMRDLLIEYPKPMFYTNKTIVHYIPAVNKNNIKEFQKAYKKNKKNPKGFKLDEEIKIWKTRKPNVRRILDNMRFYYTGLFIFISRSLLQKTLGIISTKEANIRIKKCQKVLEDHFRIMLSQNPKDHEAIKQFHEHGHGLTGNQYDIGSFRI